MHPNLQYFISKFDHYNELCFNGQLKRPPISLNTRYSALGITRGVRRKDEQGNLIWTDLSIEISVRRDLPEEEYIDTLVHEMIHFHIMSNNLEDNSVHGTLFRKKMEEIKIKQGIRITVEFSPSEEEMINTRSRLRYICTAETSDGKTLFAVVAKNKLFEFWNIMPALEGVVNVCWYVSDRAIFELFPVTVSPCLYAIDANKLHHYLTGALELENTGNEICVKQI